MWCDSMDWIQLTDDAVQCWDLEVTLMNFMISYSARNFFTN
jgi:hypothetical protein